MSRHLIPVYKVVIPPQFLALVEYSRKHKGQISSVVVYNITRFLRDAHDHQVIKARLAEYGVALRSVTEPIDETAVGRLDGNLMSAIAQFDNDVKSERTVVGMKAALQIGRWTHKAPLGYLNANRKRACLA